MQLQHNALTSFPHSLEGREEAGGRGSHVAGHLATPQSSLHRQHTCRSPDSSACRGTIHRHTHPHFRRCIVRDPNAASPTEITQQQRPSPPPHTPIHAPEELLESAQWSQPRGQHGSTWGRGENTLPPFHCTTLRRTCHEQPKGGEDGRRWQVSEAGHQSWRSEQSSHPSSFVRRHTRTTKHRMHPVLDKTVTGWPPPLAKGRRNAGTKWDAMEMRQTGASAPPATRRQK